MSTALAKLSDITGASPEEVNEVIKGMIISSKNQHGATASNAEMAVVTGTCARYGLNPLTKEAHAFISGGKLQMIIGIDGWTKIMLRQPDFDGVEFEYEWDDKNLLAVTTKIYSKERSRPTCITEWMSECKQVKSDAWSKYPNRMLRNKSLGQCVRVAFGISEVIDDDEANRIRGNSGSNTPAERDITPQPSVNFVDIETAMSDCKTLEELQAASGKIREEMQTNRLWDNHKAKVIALNIKHKDRINSKKGEVTYDEETGEELAIEQAGQAVQNQQAEPSEAEAIEGELLSASDGATRGDGEDIGFGEDLTDEFGEEK